MSRVPGLHSANRVAPNDGVVASHKLALKRAGDRKPRDHRQQPFGAYGLFAPTSAVRTIGSDAFFYMRFVQDGLLASFAVLLALLPPIGYNMGIGQAPINFTEEYTQFVDAGLLSSIDPITGVWTEGWPGCGSLGVNAPLFTGRVGGNGELAGAPRLTMIHVVCDSIAMLIFVIFIVRLQRAMLLDGDVFGKIATELKVKNLASGLTSGTTAAAGALGSVASGLGATSLVRGTSDTVGKGANAIGLGAVHKTTGAAGGEVMKLVGTGVSGAVGAVNIAGGGVKMAQATMGAVQSRIAKKTEVVATQALRLAKLPPPNDWWREPDSEMTRLDMAASMCTVVVWGWELDAKGMASEAGGAGGVPAEVVARLGAAAGEPALSVVQAHDVEQLTLKWGELSKKAKHSETLRALYTRGAKKAAEESEVKEAEAATRELEGTVSQMRKQVKPINMAFITFSSSKAADAAVALGAAGGLADLDAGLSVGAAPRPSDVVWEHLAVSPAHLGYRVFYYLGVTIVMAPLIAMVIVVATAFAMMCLFWVPVNSLLTGFIPHKLYGGMHWVWGVGMFAIVYGVFRNLIALTLSPSEAGWVPARLRPRNIRDWYPSRTSGQMHLVLIVLLVECSVLLVGSIFMFYGISKPACDFSCLCWWLNPHYMPLGSFFDYGAGFAFNTLVNSFIGDAVLNSLVIPSIGRFVARHNAKKAPTQALMDEACRAADPAYLPWRVIHGIKAWFFVVVLMPVVPFAGMPLVVYHLVSFAVDRYNILCAYEPLPPSSGLIMRYVLTWALPLTVPLHYFVGAVVFVNKARCADGNKSYQECASNMVQNGQLELVIFFVVAAVLNVYLVVEICYLQRRRALTSGLMTPWQVFQAGVRNDEGFRFAAAAEPYRFVDVSLKELGAGENEVKQMFTAELMHDDTVEANAEEWRTPQPLDPQPSN